MNLYVLAGLAVLLIAVAYFVRKSGSDSEKAKQGQANEESAERIAKAVADSPHTRDDIAKRLQSDREL